MGGRYFGTDGIRGRANRPPITPDIAMKVGMAAGIVFRNGDHQHRVVIGKDTRISSYMIETLTDWSLFRLTDVERYMELQDALELDLRIVLPLLGVSALFAGLSVWRFRHRVPA